MIIDEKLEQEVALLHQRVCSGLADPKRVLLLYALSDGPMCVSELVDALNVSQPTVSRHLRLLRDRRLVDAERRGTAVYYRLTDMRLIGALDLLRAVLGAQMTADGDMAQSLT